ncbi:MAG TPA: two-component sensor histidine kinase, partial [Roseiarcus sp.]|nr:two-component sensor histidine kinase [Roseiarcus sp.]
GGQARSLPRHGESAVDATIADVEGVLDTFNALLRIGQVEGGARRAGFKTLDLAEVARDVIEAFAPAADTEGKRLDVRLDPPLMLSGDRELLVQMIANLIDNALRHMQKGAALQAMLARLPSRLVA